MALVQRMLDSGLRVRVDADDLALAVIMRAEIGPLATMREFEKVGYEHADAMTLVVVARTEPPT